MKHPDEVLASLKAEAAGSTRTINNLDGLHKVCADVCATDKIYTVAAVGRRIEARLKANPRERVPTMATLKSVKGGHFRKLIAAWADWDLGAVTKPKPRLEPQGDEQRLLACISNPVTRAEIGLKLAELKRLRRENNELKGVTKVQIDMRRIVKSDSPQVVAPTALLSDTEREALSELIAPDFLKRHGWRPGSHGSVVWAMPGKPASPVMPAGTLTGLAKLIGQLP